MIARPLAASYFMASVVSSSLWSWTSVALPARSSWPIFREGDSASFCSCSFLFWESSWFSSLALYWGPSVAWDFHRAFICCARFLCILCFLSTSSYSPFSLKFLSMVLISGLSRSSIKRAHSIDFRWIARNIDSITSNLNYFASSSPLRSENDFVRFSVSPWIMNLSRGFFKSDNSILQNSKVKHALQIMTNFEEWA